MAPTNLNAIPINPIIINGIIFAVTNSNMALLFSKSASFAGVKSGPAFATALSINFKTHGNISGVINENKVNKPQATKVKVVRVFIFLGIPFFASGTS